MPAISFEAAALFEIIDRASPTLRLMAEQMERLEALTGGVTEKLEAISKITFSTLNRSLGTTARNMNEVTTASERMDAAFTGVQRRLDSSIERLTIMNRELRGMSTGASKIGGGGGLPGGVIGGGAFISDPQITAVRQRMAMAENAQFATDSQILAARQRMAIAEKAQFATDDQILAARRRVDDMRKRFLASEEARLKEELAASQRVRGMPLVPLTTKYGGEGPWGSVGPPPLPQGPRGGMPIVPLARRYGGSGPWGAIPPGPPPGGGGGGGHGRGAHIRAGFPVGPAHATFFPTLTNLGPTVAELAPLGLAAGLLYGAYERAQMMDVVNRIMMATGTPLGSSGMRDQLTNLITSGAQATALSMGTVGPALASEMMSMQNIPISERMKLFPSFLGWARVENLLKPEISPEEAITSTVGLMHQWGAYSPQQMVGMQRTVAALSTLGPTINIPEMEASAGYTATAARVAGIAPETIFSLLAANQLAGITSTKSGTWVEAMIEGLSPKGGIQNLLMSRQGMMRYMAMQRLGLVGAQGQPVALEMLQKGNIGGLQQLLQSHLAGVPETQRPGLLTMAIGNERGARELGRLSEPATTTQIATITSALQKFAAETPQTAIANWAQFSPMFQLQKAWIDTQKLFVDLARVTLPALQVGVQLLDTVVVKLDKSVDRMLAYFSSHSPSTVARDAARSITVGTGALPVIPPRSSVFGHVLNWLWGGLSSGLPSLLSNFNPSLMTSAQAATIDNVNVDQLNVNQSNIPMMGLVPGGVLSGSGGGLGSAFGASANYWRSKGPFLPESTAWDLVTGAESGNRNVMNYIGDATHTASGYPQITNTNWRKYAPLAGINVWDYPTTMSAPKAMQREVFDMMYERGGFSDWAPYNSKLSGELHGIHVGAIHIHGDVLDAGGKADQIVTELNNKIKKGLTHNIESGSGTLSSPWTSGLGVPF